MSPSLPVYKKMGPNPFFQNFAERDKGQKRIENQNNTKPHKHQIAFGDLGQEEELCEQADP